MNRCTALNLNNIILKIRHDNVINLMMKTMGRIIFKTTFQCPHDTIVRLNIDSCPVFISQKVGEDLKHKEIKSVLINKQSVLKCKNVLWLKTVKNHELSAISP